MENKEFNLRNYLYKNPLLEKEDTKKGNEEEQEHEEGAIKDDRDHIDALDADAEADEKKLKKLKKDKKEDVKEAALRKAIQNEIVSILREAEEFDATKDIEIEDNEEENIDIEKETDVKVDDESEESEIEVDDEVAGQDAGASAIEGLLKKARELAKEQGDKKLVTQLSNTITQHERSESAKIDQSLSENNRFTRRRK